MEKKRGKIMKKLFYGFLATAIGLASTQTLKAEILSPYCPDTVQLARAVVNTDINLLSYKTTPINLQIQNKTWRVTYFITYLGTNYTQSAFAQDLFKMSTGLKPSFDSVKMADKKICQFDYHRGSDIIASIRVQPAPPTPEKINSTTDSVRKVSLPMMRSEAIKFR